MKRILICLALSAFSGALGCDSAKVEPIAETPTGVENGSQVVDPTPSQPVDVATIQKMMKGKLTVMGEQVFSANCSKCHAFEGNPAPDLVGAGARLDEATFKDVVTNGRGKMPAHPMLTDVQKRALWLFVSNAKPGSSTAIAKDREGGGCACGGACGGDGAAAPAAKGCGGSCGQGAAAAPGEGHGCGQGAGAAPGEGHGCGQGAGAAPGEGCGAGCGQNANE
jgi:mono/diheme cytochrome c family protein